MGKSLLMSEVRVEELPEVLRVKPIKHSISMSDMALTRRDWTEPFYKDGKLRISRPLWEVMPAGIWKGQRCFVIGGGSSLKGFDFSQLKGELVITVNRGFEFCPFSAINLCQDARIFGYYENAEFEEGFKAKEKFYAYKGYKTWLNVQAFPFPEDIYQIDVCHPDDFGFKDYIGGIPPYNNSGLNALTLAVCLGADPIYLLGFDCYGKGGRAINFHSGYPDPQNDDVYASFIKDFADVAWRVKEKRATRVVNLNPDSAIKSFEFGAYKDIPKIQRPIICSYYTPEYEGCAKKMEQSAMKFGLECDLTPIKKIDEDWLKTIYYRAEFIKEMLLKHKRPIVWLDSDALILEYPDIFDDLDVDFAAFVLNAQGLYKDYPKETELLGGTMYFNYTPKTLELIDMWIKENKINSNSHLSQWVLQDALAKWDGVFAELPSSYCQIYDTMAGFGQPVIEHYVQSRRFRNA